MTSNSKTCDAQDQNQSPPPATSHEIGGIALSLRVPQFWRERPRLWFISFEAATHDLRKSQAQLAQMVIAQLDKQDVEQISDLLYNPPSEHQYHTLKERLIYISSPQCLFVLSTFDYFYSFYLELEQRCTNIITNVELEHYLIGDRPK